MGLCEWVTVAWSTSTLRLASALSTTLYILVKGSGYFFVQSLSDSVLQTNNCKPLAVVGHSE